MPQDALTHRGYFDKDKIKSLGESLKEKGIIQPIVVRKDKTGEGYELIAGERRFRAWSYTGKPTIPAVIKDVDDFTAKELSIIENWHREDLTDVEKEKFLFSLWSENKYKTYSEMSEKLGIERTIIGTLIASHIERNSIKNEEFRQIADKIDYNDLAKTRIIKTPEIRTELLKMRVSVDDGGNKLPPKITVPEMQTIIKSIKDDTPEQQAGVVKLISSEKLEPKDVERFVKVLKESPADIQEKMLKQEITPEEAEEVRIFKTPEQRAQVIEERKIRKEEFAETTKRDVLVRKHMADEVELGKEPTIIHEEFDAIEKDEDASAQRIVERYQDIYLHVISFRADHVLGIKNAEQQKQCIEIIKKTIAHCNAVLLGVDQLKTIIKYR